MIKSKSYFFLLSFFLLFVFLIFSAELVFSNEAPKICYESQELCGNGIDEDCSGSDLICNNCVENAIDETGCDCGGKPYYSGFCCGTSWQSTPCGGEIYYVDTKGDDTNSGSKLEPFKTLRRAVKSAKAGDAIFVNPGRHIERKQISIRVSGTKNRPIIIRGDGEESFIDLSQCKKRNGLEVYFANYIIIEKLKIRASDKAGSRGIRLTHSEGSIIRNNKVFGGRHANIFCSLSDSTVFENNEAFDGHIGIYASDSSDFLTIKDNILHNNTLIGLHMNGDINSGRDGIMSKCVISNNTIYNNGTGINCDGVIDSIFRNNLLYNNSKRGIAFFKGDGSMPSINNFVVHNTIVMPQGAYYAIGLNTGAYKNFFFNNIIFCKENVPCFSTTGKVNELQIKSDYNLYSRNGVAWEIDDSAYRFGKWEKFIRKNIHAVSKYIQRKKNDQHSLHAAAEDIFENFKKNDFRLKPRSPAINNGTPEHSYGKDFQGTLRSKNGLPDIGAFEYAPKKNSNKQISPVASLKATKNSKLVRRKTAQIHGRTKPKKIRRFENDLGMVFQYIEPGIFKMGTDCSSKSNGLSSGCHQANLTKGFYLQTTEVTQGQWKSIMNDNPSFFKQCGDNCPVEQVSWIDVQRFIKRLNQAEHSSMYRLPSEAEWEYACRAGTETPFSFGRCLSTEKANYCGEYPVKGCQKGVYRKKTVQVNSLPSNAWGLTSMHGNVWEWCQDWLSEYPHGASIDSAGPPEGKLRVIRGGGWNSYENACASGNRAGVRPDDFYANLGFRLVREAAPKTK